MAILKKIYPYEVRHGNEGVPEGERIVAYLRRPSVDVKNQYLSEWIKEDAATLYERMMDPERSKDMRMQLKNHVVRFDNLKIEDENGVERDITVDDLFDSGEFGLIMELFQQLVSSSQLRVAVKRDDGTKDDSVDEVKNSESPSGSSVTPIAQ